MGHFAAGELSPEYIHREVGLKYSLYPELPHIALVFWKTLVGSFVVNQLYTIFLIYEPIFFGKSLFNDNYYYFYNGKIHFIFQLSRLPSSLRGSALRAAAAETLGSPILHTDFRSSTRSSKRLNRRARPRRPSSFIINNLAFNSEEDSEREDSGDNNKEKTPPGVKNLSFINKRNHRKRVDKNSSSSDDAHIDSESPRQTSDEVKIHSLLSVVIYRIHEKIII